MRINHGQHQSLVMQRSRPGQSRQLTSLAAGRFNSRRFEDCAQRSAMVMRRIHLEHVKVWGGYESIFGGQKERVKIVDELRDVRHRYFVGMAIENIERQRRD